MTTDCIAAVATPNAPGAIAVVRMSGDGTLGVLESVFRPLGGKTYTPKSHVLYCGHIVDNGVVVDEVMCAVMVAPRSYTREDVAEIFCHGGPATVRGVLNALLTAGARPAQPGEFTKRAFLNGRLDLSQAEAVAELLAATDETARRAGLRKLSGGLSRRVRGFRERILTWMAHIALSVDYPEHEDEADNLTRIAEEGAALLAEMERLRATALAGRRVRQGVTVAIVGRPNVGKSSLMNGLLSADRAIVTDAPGTTLDVLTENLILRGVALVLSDTAGIREGIQNEAEALGIARSKEQLASADVVLWVVDGSCAMTDADRAVAALCGPNTVVVVNKQDLPGVTEATEITEVAKKWPTVAVSAKDGTGLDALASAIQAVVADGYGDFDPEGDLITNQRHEHLLTCAVDHLRAACDAAVAGLTEDLVSLDLNAAYRALGEILGEAVGEDLLDKIFAEFCVGK